MKNKTTILFNNIDQDYKGTKQYLFETFAEEEGWESIDDIEDCIVYHEIEENEKQEWDSLLSDLQYIFEKDYYLIMGTCGKWYGPSECGMFIHNTDDLLKFIKHLDYIKFYDKNGHLYISGYHHDGSDSYEVKRLTKKGYEFADRNYFAHDKALHSTIMNTNFYSALPRLAERLYGV